MEQENPSPERKNPGLRALAAPVVNLSEVIIYSIK